MDTEFGGQFADYRCPDCGATYRWDGVMVDGPSERREDTIDEDQQLLTDGGRDTAAITRWFRCPECGGDDLCVSYNNGRLSVSCDECYAATSKLVGRGTFR